MNAHIVQAQCAGQLSTTFLPDKQVVTFGENDAIPYGETQPRSRPGQRIRGMDPVPWMRSFAPVNDRSCQGLVGRVTAVSRSLTHTMAKGNEEAIRLLEDLGVEGDAHAGTTVKHRSRVRQDPSQPNLRQVHLIHAELHDELRAKGFILKPGQMGENITTRGIDLLSLPKGTLLHIGDEVVVGVTGLRNPCTQLDGLHPGLMSAVLDRDAEGNLIRRSGIMGVVLHGGEVKPGDAIRSELPPQPHIPLDRV